MPRGVFPRPFLAAERSAVLALLVGGIALRLAWLTWMAESDSGAARNGGRTLRLLVLSD